jgi:hypothetical protein
VDRLWKTGYEFGSQRAMLSPRRGREKGAENKKFNDSNNENEPEPQLGVVHRWPGGLENDGVFIQNHRFPVINLGLAAADIAELEIKKHTFLIV